MSTVRRQRGFTLVEILFALTIFLLLVTGVMSVFVSVSRVMIEISDTMALNATTRVLQDRLLLDLHSIVKVTAMAEQSFTATFTDIATGASGTITYSFTNGTLQKVTNVNGVQTTFVAARDLVTNPAAPTRSKFVFINRTGSSSATATQPAEVRSIQVSVVPQNTARQTLGLVRGVNDPFCTALVQLRNITN